MKQTLILVLNLANGKTTDFSISAPRTDLEVSDIEKLVTKLVTSKFFIIDGAEVVSCKKAYIRTIEAKVLMA